MTALGRDLPVAEYLSSVAMNVFDGGIAVSPADGKGSGSPAISAAWARHCQGGRITQISNVFVKDCQSSA
jgi:hypothetical protein